MMHAWGEHVDDDRVWHAGGSRAEEGETVLEIRQVRKSRLRSVERMMGRGSGKGMMERGSGEGVRRGA